MILLLVSGFGWAWQEPQFFLPLDDENQELVGELEVAPGEFEFLFTRLAYSSPGYRFGRPELVERRLS